MSKHSVRQPKPAIAKHSAPLRRRGQRQQIIAVCVLLSLIGAGAALAQWRSLSASAKLNMASAPPMLLAQTTNNLAPNTPAKEYVYAGGRLLATEEPALANNATFVSQAVPATMTAGQSYAVTVVMRNSGTTTWTSGALYRLGSQNPQDNLTWGMGRVELPSAVAPGATATFNFTVTAPLAAGNYNFQWRMVQEGIGWFGDTAPNVAVAVNSVPTNNATYVSQTVPATMTTGQSYPVTITLTNTGNTYWTPSGTNPYSLASLNQTWGLNNVTLAGVVTPNGTVTFSFNVTAPATPGTYSFQWRMLQQNIEWFGDYTPAISVTVTAQAGGGAVSGGIVSMGTTTVNLSQEGTLDWAHWGGQYTAASFDHKASVAQQISNYSVIGSGVVNAYGNHNYGFSWTDGTPTPSATATTTGVYVTGLGNGYRITVPADTTTRTLKLYTGVYYAQGKLDARLSDSSSPAYIDTSLNNNAGVSNGVYTLAYHAASAGQTLTVTFTMQSDYGGNVAMQAATLSGSGGTSLTAPSNLVATATSTTQVSLTWTASTGGTVDHYRVERSQSSGAPFIPLQASPAGTNFTDTTATSGVAYLYRVCAVDAAGNLSAYSNTDLATAITFTDDPLTSGVTVIKAQHLMELRQAVNAVRATANLTAAGWTDIAPQGIAIKAVHLQELRTNLDQALSTLGMTTPPYTDPNLVGVGVKKIHVEELRQRVK